MPELTIRRATPEDAPACGVICYQAFHDINTAHNFRSEALGRRRLDKGVSVAVRRSR